MPRVLVDVSNVDLSTVVLGKYNVKFPVFVAPTAMQKMAHHQGEMASSRAASSHGTIFTLSSLSTTTLEEVAKEQDSIFVAGGGVFRWFQLYVSTDRKVTEELAKRAEASGYQALVVTVDAPVIGTREADIRNRFALPPHLKLANYEEKADARGSAIQSFSVDKSLQWKDIQWLKSITTLPVILKGIHSPLDAVRAIEEGVQGIIVSNHGGRQLDGVPATISVLPNIVDAIKEYKPNYKESNFSIYMDGGIRRGSDIFKALALGAQGVFIGRPVIWGLSYSGQQGVEHVLEILRDELATCMRLAGVNTIHEINRSFITSQGRLMPKFL